MSELLLIFGFVLLAIGVTASFVCLVVGLRGLLRGSSSGHLEREAGIRVVLFASLTLIVNGFASIVLGGVLL